MVKFDDWLKTADGKTCLDTGILKHEDQLKYLQNRLWYAYTAGYEQGLQFNPETGDPQVRKEDIGKSAPQPVQRDHDMKACLALVEYEKRWKEHRIGWKPPDMQKVAVDYGTTMEEMKKHYGCIIKTVTK